MDKDKSEPRKLAVKILDNMLKGIITPQQAIDEWPINKDDKFLGRVGALLYHYLADEDIRKKDPYYMKYQKEFFESLSNELKE